MEQKLINIGNKSYRCKIADNDEDRKQGLMNIENLPPDEGMLFVWKEEDTHQMWMKNTKIPLDMIAINGDDEVIMVYPAKPNDETLIPFMGSKYILEVNTDSGIKVGDDFEIDEDENLDKYVMKVLALDGSTQMLLQGGERIFSRISTRQMIKWAKKAEQFKDDSEKFNYYCSRLGRRAFRELKALDNRQPEYVQTPNNTESTDKNN